MRLTPSEKGAFGDTPDHALFVVEHREHLNGVHIVVSTFNTQCSLADGVENSIRFDNLTDAIRPLQALQAGDGGDHCIVAELLRLEFLPARVHVASNVLVDELRVVQLQLCDATR